MAEREELRLTVTVDDQASAQLQALRGQLSAMGSGPQAAGMERARRQTAAFSSELRGLATRAGIVGGVVGGLVGKVVDWGIELVRRVSDIKAYSEALTALHRNSQLAGASTAQFQASINAMALSGIGPEKAAAGLLKFGEVWVDLQRQNSQFRQSMLRPLMEPRERASMENMLTDMMRTDTTNAANIALEYADKILQTDRGTYTQRLQIRQQFLTRFGLEGIEPGRRLPVVSREDQARVEARERAAKQYQELLTKEKTIWDGIFDTLKAIGLQYGGFNSSLETSNTAAIAVRDSLHEWEAALRKTDGSLGQIIETTKTWGLTAINQTKTWGQELIDQWMRFIGITKDEPIPGSREDIQKKQMEEFRRREAERIAREAAEQKTFEEQQDIERQKRPPAPLAPPLAATTTPSPPPPPVLSSEERRARALKRETLPGLLHDLILGTTPPPEATLPRPPSATMPSPAPAPLRPRNLFAPRTEEEVTAEAPTTQVPRIVPGGEVSTTMPLPLRTRPAPLFPAGAGTPDDQTRQMQVLTDEIRRLSTTLQRDQPGAVAPAPPTAVARPETTTPSQQPQLQSPQPQPQPQPQPPQPQPQPPPQPQLPQPAQAPQPPTSILPPQAGAVPAIPSLTIPTQRPLRGQPRTGLMDGPTLDQAQAAQTLDTRMLDRAAARDINVNGTGKISVDVRAPPGTRVNAEAGGLFKRTELTRQTQMMPAEAGPAAVTGIGAAEG